MKVTASNQTLILASDYRAGSIRTGVPSSSAAAAKRNTIQTPDADVSVVLTSERSRSPTTVAAHVAEAANDASIAEHSAGTSRTSLAPSARAPAHSSRYALQQYAHNSGTHAAAGRSSLIDVYA